VESLLEARKNLTVLSGRVRRDSSSCDKLTRDGIGVEKFGGGNDLAQTIAEGALAGGNAASDSNCGHERS
jgi:hypothetical protein